MQDRPASDIGFTPAVKAVQTRRGSREQYRRYEQRGGWRTEVDADLVEFLAEIDTAYLPTVSSEGQPHALFEIEAWDANCPQHIPRKLDAVAAEATIGRLTARIEALEAELARTGYRQPA